MLNYIAEAQFKEDSMPEISYRCGPSYERFKNIRLCGRRQAGDNTLQLNIYIAW
jgi:hypothetical protein